MPLDRALATIVDQMVIYFMLKNNNDVSKTRVTLQIDHNSLYDPIYTPLTLYSASVAKNIKRQLARHKFDIDLRLPLTVNIDFCLF